MSRELGRESVAVLGATGLVGQKAIAMLEGHPRYYVGEVAASDRREGKEYGDVVEWRESRLLSESVACLRCKRLLDVESSYVISGLPASVAAEVEPVLAARGTYVSTNASALRMKEDVPILIPEVNSDHLALLERQKTSGKVVTNPNCTTTFIALALRPLMELGTFEQVSVVTMQAISGAGYPGIDSLDIMGNVIPYIVGEEEKIEAETRKILGTADEAASFGMTTHVHRVPVVNGHTIVLHIHFTEKVDLQEVRDCYFRSNERWPGLYHLYEDPMRPQPVRDIGVYDQSAHIGRIKHGAERKIVGLVVMGNNLVRGAAGASLRNMEATLEFFENADG